MSARKCLIGTTIALALVLYPVDAYSQRIGSIDLSYVLKRPVGYFYKLNLERVGKPSNNLSKTIREGEPPIVDSEELQPKAPYKIDVDICTQTESGEKCERYTTFVTDAKLKP